MHLALRYSISALKVKKISKTVFPLFKSPRASRSLRFVIGLNFLQTSKNKAATTVNNMKYKIIRSLLQIKTHETFCFLIGIQIYSKFQISVDDDANYLN